ncbi:MAG: beta-lactamase family protein [Pseudonocardia sp.]|uniref:serine hydrolase domain-containing protein n=1 Tax=unclassified Pseudonocardia TaxID=2619320 RepID=UPI00086D95C5|nr:MULTISPECIES: serine hydrolase domain-containing protein [unclassified Pseudonocardia]MBN9108298.1 beta-lactamase family protein [Pseudonocardia sp.]ODU29023.1 MAG: D-alanyl-D-alanine carboxypeptidase [Pseudonocardia sp. SCN 72-51]ODV08685.1 MAG: D-alanyl-D-alanine carboxypeptidase [Pseudonocardia sp. SCN 73-27]
MRRLTVLPAAVLALGLLAGCGTPATTGPAFVAEVQTRIDAAMRDNVIPGAIVRIASPTDGEWTGTFGTATLGTDDPMTVDDHVRAGSITKTMTSTVILQLLQEGKLALTDPIGKYRAGVPNGDRVTIAQLAEMRSGLYSYTFDRGFNETLDADPGKAWTPDELLAIAFAHPPNAEPGTTFEYSNTNIVLLGLVIEQLTGMPVEKAFQERIFTPLGMTGSSLPVRTDAAIPGPHPRGYSFGTNVSTIDGYALPEAEQAAAKTGTLEPNDETDANPSWAWTAGGAISTVPDLFTYVGALVGGGLLDPATQKLRLDSIQPTDPAEAGGGGYGIGIAKFGPIVGHDGQIPGFMTFTGQDPTTGLRITIATNLATVPSGEGSALTLLKAILPVFYPDMRLPGDPAAAPTR